MVPRALLMKCYLNKAVYSGDRKTMTFAAADMQQVAALADQNYCKWYV